VHNSAKHSKACTSGEAFVHYYHTTRTNSYINIKLYNSPDRSFRTLVQMENTIGGQDLAVMYHGTSRGLPAVKIPYQGQS